MSIYRQDLDHTFGAQVDQAMEHIITDAKTQAGLKVVQMVENNLQHAAATDPVNFPSHYARLKFEPIRVGVENYGAGVLITKINKYNSRYDAKNGMEDLQKAMRCQEMLIAFVGGDPDWWRAKPKPAPKSFMDHPHQSRDAALGYLNRRLRSHTTLSADDFATAYEILHMPPAQPRDCPDAP